MSIILDTTNGFVPPSLTTTQRNAIVSPISGAIIKNTTTGSIEIYDGSAGWTVFSSTGLIPIGMPMLWLTETCPYGYLPLEGGSVSRTTYAALFAVYGVTFGAVDGTHFTLPKFNGRVPRGWDHGAGVDPQAVYRINRGDGTTGDHIGTLQEDSVQGHGHDVGVRYAAGQVPGTLALGLMDGGAGPSVGNYATNAGMCSLDGFGTVLYSTESRMKNIAVMYITRYM